MIDVFISYKRERRELVERLAAVLEAYGFAVWWDYGLFVGAQNYAAELEAKLSTASAVIVLWCSGSRASIWVQDEARRAGAKLLPARIEAVEPPLGHGMAQTADLVHWTGAPEAEGILQLVEGLERLTGHPPRKSPNMLRQLAKAPPLSLPLPMSILPDADINAPPLARDGAGAVSRDTRLDAPAGERWRRIEASTDPRDYEDFLAVFAQAPEAFEARRHKRQLEDWAAVDKNDLAAVAAVVERGPFAGLVAQVEGVLTKLRAGMAATEEASATEKARIDAINQRVAAAKLGEIIAKPEIAGAGVDDFGVVLRAIREAFRNKVDAIVQPLSQIAVRLTRHDIAQALAERMRGVDSEEVTVVAVGKFKVGKSTLLNALLGAGSDDLRPLPVDDLPCTPMPIRLRYAERPYVRPHAWDRKTNSIGAVMTERTLEDFHEQVRIYARGNETNLFDDIAEFEVGWPSPLLRAGLTLIDTPGVGNSPARDGLTRKTLYAADAVIVVYRSDTFAGTDEIAFAQEVTERAVKALTVVNVFGGDTMPLSPTLEAVARERLGLDPARSLDEQNIHFVHFKHGLEAAQKGDPQRLTHSGLAAFHARLTECVLSGPCAERQARALTAVKGESERLLDAARRQLAVANGDLANLPGVLDGCKRDLAALGERRQRLKAILRVARDTACGEALQSFKASVVRIADAMPAKLERMPLSMDGVLDKINAGTLQTKKWVEKNADQIIAAVREELEVWATADPSDPGLAQDLRPTVDTLFNSLGAQAEEIEETIHGMHARIAELNPALQGNGAAGALPFGPFGIVAAGLGLGLGAGLLHLAVPPVVIITAVATLGAVAGAWIGPTAGAEVRLKKKAWEAVEPHLRRMVQDPKAEAHVRAYIVAWFDQLESRIIGGLDQIVGDERRALEELEGLVRSGEPKEAMVARLKQHQDDVAALQVAVERLESELH